MNDPRWIPALMAALRDPNAAVRSAAWVPGNLKHRPAVAALTAALEDSAPEVQAAAAAGLRQVK